MDITPEQGMEIQSDLQVSITFTAGQWANILQALDEMPHKIARPLSDTINQAIMKEAAPKPEATTPKPPKSGRANKKA